MTPDSWRLYATDAHYDSLDNGGYDDREFLLSRYALCVLSDHAATLGVIDVTT